MTDNLRAFLAARLDEDEEGARNALSAHWRPDGVNSCQVFTMAEDFSTRTIAWCKNGHDDDFANALHIARHDPARVLREVAAKRALLAAVDGMRHYEVDEDGYGSCAAIVAYEELQGPCDCNLPARQLQILRPLASVWSDHPSYRTEWAS